MSSIPQGRVCTMCRTWKPLTDFDKSPKGRYGRDARCKVCKAAYYQSRRDHFLENNKRRYRENYEQYREAAGRWAKDNPDLYRQWHRENYQRNKETIQAQKRTFAEQHPERVKVWKRKEYLNHTARYRAHAEAWRRANLKKARASVRRWERNNPIAARMKVHRRRIRVQQAGPACTPEQWHTLCSWFGNVCLRCSEALPLTIDHVVPLIHGGTNHISNLQPLCMPCNSTKGTQHTDYRDPEHLALFLHIHG